jgi:predicted ribosomally synthesized peptide with SipW-like signal peptide
MKKVGLLLLALVIALGGLGVGYAKWSDSVTISGTVYTGDVEIGILDGGVGDDGADPQYEADGFNNDEGKDVAEHTSTNVGTSVFTLCDAAYYAKISETIDNAYPGYASSTTILLGNNGSIPVKIDDVRFDSTTFSDPLNVLAFMEVDGWTLSYLDEDLELQEDSGVGYESLTTYEHLQIPAGTCATLVINFHFNEDVNIDDDPALEVMPQNATCTFDVILTASQWNEVN